jgi:hypothetical protein
MSTVETGANIDADTSGNGMSVTKRAIYRRTASGQWRTINVF